MVNHIWLWWTVDPFFHVPKWYWLVVLTCFNHLEKSEFVSWDDEIPYIMDNKKMFQTTNQDRCMIFGLYLFQWDWIHDDYPACSGRRLVSNLRAPMTWYGFTAAVNVICCSAVWLDIHAPNGIKKRSTKLLLEAQRDLRAQREGAFRSAVCGSEITSVSGRLSVTLSRSTG